MKALLDKNPEPSEEDIRNALSGNLCRCTGYTQMYQAIKAAITAELSWNQETSEHQKKQNV